MKNRSLKNKLNRVDIQVSGIILVIVTLSFFCVYLFSYKITYADTLNTLKERSDSIHDYLEEQFDMKEFLKFDSKEDIESDDYLHMKDRLSKVKEVTNVRYLYSAKVDESGNLIYVVDGLPLGSADFRYPGDRIEDEIIPDLNRALSNEVVYPNDILDTEWGPIFISYYPLHEDGQVVGVIGIEFAAEHQYDTYRLLRIGTPIIGGIFALLAIIIAVYLFKRISNPSRKDLANTDFLTQLKSRNAFEVDIQNNAHHRIGAQYHGIIIVDMNGLKQINDHLGHEVGDSYLNLAATILKEEAEEALSVYRVGGDEFAILYTTLTEQMAKEFIDKVHKRCEKESEHLATPISLAIGYACYDELMDKEFQDMYRRADEYMYKQKLEIKNNGEK